MEIPGLFCMNECPHFSAQVRSAESGDYSLPSRMCPRVAALTIVGFGHNLVGQTTTDPVANKMGEVYASYVQEEAQTLDKSADECAERLNENGADSISFNEALTVSDIDILKKLSRIGDIVMLEQGYISDDSD